MRTKACCGSWGCACCYACLLLCAKIEVLKFVCRRMSWILFYLSCGLDKFIEKLNKNVEQRSLQCEGFRGGEKSGAALNDA